LIMFVRVSSANINVCHNIHAVNNGRVSLSQIQMRVSNDQNDVVTHECDCSTLNSYNVIWAWVTYFWKWNSSISHNIYFIDKKWFYLSLV
jgi:hypothetical protein